jgi:hypothetical protein
MVADIVGLFVPSLRNTIMVIGTFCRFVFGHD